jgi:hypothetical protein
MRNRPRLFAVSRSEMAVARADAGDATILGDKVVVSVAAAASRRALVNATRGVLRENQRCTRGSVKVPLLVFPSPILPSWDGTERTPTEILGRKIVEFQENCRMGRALTDAGVIQTTSS